MREVLVLSLQGEGKSHQGKGLASILVLSLIPGTSLLLQLHSAWTECGLEELSCHLCIFYFIFLNEKRD